MKIPYPIISATSPFYYVTVSGIDLSKIVTTGDTKLQVYRVWTESAQPVAPPDTTALNMPPYYISPYNIPPYYTGGSVSVPIDPIDFTPVEQRKNRFTFVFGDTLFAKIEGRYRADFYYKGTYISSAYFMYSKPKMAIMGSANV